MTERRLVIDPQEILHVEIHCSECEAVNLVPVRLPDQLAKFTRAGLAGEFNVFTQCFSCGDPFTPPIAHKIRALVSALAELGTGPGPRRVRLVVKDVPARETTPATRL